jgi:glycosyltransferase involved in cell wall biosynthesis
MSNNEIAIVATSHHSFAGGGKNKTRILHELAKLGYDVSYVGIKTPHLFEYTETTVQINTIDTPVVHAFDDNSLFVETALSEKITEIALQKSLYKNVILWGSNLFPFVNAILGAKSNLLQNDKIKFPMISFPVGSDIWQVGPRYKNAARKLIYSEMVDCRITYTQAFADEISIHYGNKGDRKFEIIPPILDTEKFNPVSLEIKENLKEKFGLLRDVTVIIDHSNMRPIKRPQDVIKVVELASRQTKRKLALLMVGPCQDSFLGTLFDAHWEMEIIGGCRIIKNEFLAIYWTGVVSNVEDYLRMSDIAINCSLHDSFNISLMEAMASGVPCVTTNVVGVAPHVLASQGGYLSEINNLDLFEIDRLLQNDDDRKFVNHEDMADKLIYLIENDAERQVRGEKASKYFHNNFAPEIILRKYQILFDKLIEGAFEK